MDRTAEEFVHRLPNGRWFVGDFVRTQEDGQELFLVEAFSTRIAVEVTMALVERRWSRIPTYARKSSAKRAAQQMIERVLDEDDDEAKGRPSCVCDGLGAYVHWNGSTENPGPEVRACPEHPLGPADQAPVERDVAGAMRVKECLAAIADLRDILWPGGDSEASWSPDTAEAVGRRLAFLAPTSRAPSGRRTK
jgi:hypothetical protein